MDSKAWLICEIEHKRTMLQGCFHQEFQVPKTEVRKNLIRLFGGFPLHKPYPYSLYRFSYLHFRHLKCLVMLYHVLCFYNLNNIK